MREQLDIDSFDFLNVIVHLHERLGVATPEADYQKLATSTARSTYLADRLDSVSVTTGADTMAAKTLLFHERALRADPPRGEHAGRCGQGDPRTRRVAT